MVFFYWQNFGSVIVCVCHFFGGGGREGGWNFLHKILHIVYAPVIQNKILSSQEYKHVSTATCSTIFLSKQILLMKYMK